VGASYACDSHRIVFIGKTARGWNSPDELAQQGFIDGTGMADQLIHGRSWPYWSYTNSILETVFGSLHSGWERIAFTNLVKCNNSDGADTTPRTCAAHCLDDLGVVWKELEILKPKNIIMYTGDHYDDFIERYSLGYEYQDKTRRDHRIPNGKKMMLWWERHCVDRDGRRFRILRTAHPERQQKESFVCQIAR